MRLPPRLRTRHGPDLLAVTNQGEWWIRFLANIPCKIGAFDCEPPKAAICGLGVTQEQAVDTGAERLLDHPRVRADPRLASESVQ